MKPEEFEQEWKRYCDSKGGGAVTISIKDVANHFAQWQKEQMMKGAIEGKVVAVRNTMSDRLHIYPWIELEAQLSKNDKVKVIIIKE